MRRRRLDFRPITLAACAGAVAASLLAGRPTSARMVAGDAGLGASQRPSPGPVLVPIAARSARLGVRQVPTVAPLPATVTPTDPAPTVPPTATAPCATPTMPRPTRTPLPLPTDTPRPTPARTDVPHGRPDRAVLEIDGADHRLPYGTFCWNGLCEDCDGVPTQLEPLRVHSPFVARLRLPPASPPTGLAFYVRPVRQGDEIGVTAETRWWQVDRDDPFIRLDLVREQDFQIARGPGWYVLDFFGWWAEPRGDVNYGFLVEVIQ
jgi:hypothetical protein